MSFSSLLPHPGAAGAAPSSCTCHHQAGTEGHSAASPRRLATPSLGGWPRPPSPAGHAPEARTGGAVRLVLGHPRLGGDGDMESGAYGAANAGGSFDLRRFVSQPQVVTRLVSMVSRPERTRNRASWPSGPVDRRLPSTTGDCGRTSQAWRGARGPRSPPRLCPLQAVRPVACPTAWLRILSQPLGPGPRRALNHWSGPPWCGMSPRCSGVGGQARRLAGSRWGFGATPQQVACTPRFPAWGIHLEGTF